MKKTVFKNFQYMECDDFAAFLHDMSAKGWHFKEWRIGLVFEKGEPADLAYAVEVFPKGSEMDTFANPDTEEFAEYCEAAGWKFLDSRQKFCIFRQVSPDAPPIVEPQERLCNILQAERKSWLIQFFSYALLFLLYWGQFLFVNFSRWIFNNVMLLVLAVFAIMLFAQLIKGAALLYRAHSFRSALKKGILPRYGNESRLYHLLKNYRPIMLVIAELALIAFTWQDMQRAAAVTAGITFIVMLAGLTLIAWLRPSRAGNWIGQIALGLTIPFLAIIIIISSFSLGRNSDAQEISGIEIPLPQNAFGQYSLEDFGQSQSLLGTMCYYYITYTPDNSIEAKDQEPFWLWSYQSAHAWILDRIWKEETQNANARYEDCAEQWDAVSAYRSRGGGNYYIRYPDQVAVFWISADLSAEQIESMKQTLRADPSLR